MFNLLTAVGSLCIDVTNFNNLVQITAQAVAKKEFFNFITKETLK